MGDPGPPRVSAQCCPHLSPIQVVQQLQGTTFLQTVRALAADGSAFRGFRVNCFFESTRFIYMLSYEGLKKVFTPRAELTAGSVDGRMIAAPLPLSGRVMAGAGANMIAWAIIYPIDVVKTIQQARFCPYLLHFLI